MQRLALVTGGAGFIGSHLVDSLVETGWRVRVLDNMSSGNMDNLSGVQAEVEFIEADVRELAACRTAAAGVDSVFHLAAIASVASSVAVPIESHNVT